MSSEQNKAIVRRLFEEPWKGNLDVVDELIASDYVGHDPANPEPLRGPQGVKEFISTYLAAFPDARITVEQQLAEGLMKVPKDEVIGEHRLNLCEELDPFRRIGAALLRRLLLSAPQGREDLAREEV